MGTKHLRSYKETLSQWNGTFAVFFCISLMSRLFELDEMPIKNPSLCVLGSNGVGVMGQIETSEKTSIPSKHKTLSQCWLNVGPPSTTSPQHWAGIGSISNALYGNNTIFVLNNIYFKCFHSIIWHWKIMILCQLELEIFSKLDLHGGKHIFCPNFFSGNMASSRTKWYHS